MLAGTALSVLIAAISFRLIEQPLLHLKPGRVKAAPSAACFGPTGEVVRDG